MVGMKNPLSLFTRPQMGAPRPPAAGPSAANAGAQIVGAHADAVTVGTAAHGAATSPTRPQLASTPAGMAQQAADTMSTASSAANLGALGQQGYQTIASGLSGRPPAGLGLMGKLAGGFGPAAAAMNTAVAAHQTAGVFNNPNATMPNKLHAGTTTALTALSGFPNPLVSVPAAIASQLMGMPNVPNAQ